MWPIAFSDAHREGAQLFRPPWTAQVALRWLVQQAGGLVGQHYLHAIRNLSADGPLDGGNQEG